MRSVIDNTMDAKKIFAFGNFPEIPAASWQYIIKVMGVAIASVFSAQVALTAIGMGAEASVVWPPAGIALAAILLWGNHLWLGIFLGDWLLMHSLNSPATVAFGSALGSTLAALVGARLLQKVNFSPALARLRDIFALVFIGAAFSPLVNIGIDALTQGLLGTFDWQNVWHKSWIIWLGDAIAILVLTPLCLRLRLAHQALLQSHTPRRIIEASVCFFCLALLCWIVFACKSLDSLAIYPLEYLPFPFVVWAALRFRTWGAVISSSLVATMALLGVSREVGPFVLHSDLPSQAILLLDIFLGVVTITALMLSAVVSERQVAEEERQTALERERLLAQVALRIRQSLELEQTFVATVAEIRNLFNVDRVYVGYLDANDQPKIAAESVARGYPSVVQWQPDEESINATKAFFEHHSLLLIKDTAARPQNKLPFPPALRTFYQHYQVRAVLAIPLRSHDKLSGVLVAHQCHAPRHWEASEIEFFQQLGNQVAIAIQQAQLYHQVQQLNCNLEQQVKERTQQLQEKMQEVQELYDMKNVFLQAVSHDIRTSIMGLLMLLKNLNRQENQQVSLPKAMLQRIIDSSDRQLTLINALSEDHFQEPTKVQLNIKPVCLSNLIAHIAEEWQEKFEQNQGKVITQFIPDLPPVMGDAIALKQVLGHLFCNALKHNPPGVTLTITAHQEQDMLCCYLSDDGLGMSPHQCDQLFKLYIRSIHNHRLTGIGLGSYQCRQIIEAHGGLIGVNSTPGKGTQFWFKLPFIKRPLPASVPESQHRDCHRR